MEGAFSSLYETTDIKLGSGAFGTVYGGIKKDTLEDVAIKAINKNTRGVDMESVLAEAQILKMLNHPNIVKVFDFFEEQDSFYICMELVTGGELFDRIVTKQYYNEKDARDLSVILLAAVRHCHEHGVVHRDIKAENLLLVSDKDDATVKLVDFGLSARATERTLVGQYGTYEYMAPEMWGGKILYGPPVDMWAVGVLVYILLAGYQPFNEESREDLKAKIQQADFFFHEEYWGLISDEAKDFVTKLLTVDASQRLTVEQAQNHPWLGVQETSLTVHNLESSLVQMKSFNARRKLKASQHAVRAIGKMISVMNAAKVGKWPSSSSNSLKLQQSTEGGATVDTGNAVGGGSGDDGSPKLLQQQQQGQLVADSEAFSARLDLDIPAATATADSSGAAAEMTVGIDHTREAVAAAGGEGGQLEEVVAAAAVGEGEGRGGGEVEQTNVPDTAAEVVLPETETKSPTIEEEITRPPTTVMADVEVAPTELLTSVPADALYSANTATNPISNPSVVMEHAEPLILDCSRPVSAKKRVL